MDPYLLPGGARGCLVLHGFTGGPGEVLPLGHTLAAAGMTVLGLTLPGHSGRPADLAAVRWQDWLQAVLDGYDALSGRCTEISAAGFSLGGVLAALLAARRPLHRLALLAAPYRLMGRSQELLVAGLGALGGWYHPLARADLHSADVQHAIRRRTDGVMPDPATLEVLRHEVVVAYSALDGLNQALAALRRQLPYITAPTLIQHGQLDTVVPVSAARQIAAGLGAARREIAIWPRSGHFLLDDVEGLAVIARARAHLTAGDSGG